MAAAKGNRYAAKDNRLWGDTIRRKVAQDPNQLERIALKVLAAAEQGEPWAVTEVRNTLDGKPVQPVDHTFEEKAPTLSDALLAFVAQGGKPEDYGKQTEH